MPVVEIYEVYGYGMNPPCVGFLKEDDAQKQTILSPSDGPYKANVSFTEEEYEKLKQIGYVWL